MKYCKLQNTVRLFIETNKDERPIRENYPDENSYIIDMGNWSVNCNIYPIMEEDIDNFKMEAESIFGEIRNQTDAIHYNEALEQGIDFPYERLEVYSGCEKNLQGGLTTATLIDYVRLKPTETDGEDVYLFKIKDYTTILLGRYDKDNGCFYIQRGDGKKYQYEGYRVVWKEKFTLKRK